MAVVAVAPIVLSDVTLKIAASNYEAHVSSVELTPSPVSASFKGMTPTAVFNLAGASTWQAALTFAQDWATTNSLSAYLFDNEGTNVVMDFYPKSGGTGFRCTVSLVSGSIGGSVDSVAVSTVTLPVSGKPARITGA